MLGDVCHNEDASKPCPNPNCELHSNLNTPAISRSHSAVDLATMNAHNLQTAFEEDENEHDNHSAEDSGEEDDIDPAVVERQTQQAVEAEGMHMSSFQVHPLAEPAQTVPEPPSPSDDMAAEGAMEPIEALPAGSPPPQQNDLDNTASAPGAKHFDSQQAAPVGGDLPSHTADETLEHSSQSPPAIGSAPVVTEEISTGINWDFDNMSELQAHVSGSDPFEQLKRQAPERSSSFPPVPPLSGHANEPDEKSLLAMMAIEAAATAGEGERGPFDSPTADEGGLFRAEDTHGSFFGRQDSFVPDGKVMGGTSLGAQAEQLQEKEDHVGDDASRFEEGVPLIAQALEPEERHEHKKEVHFFDDEKTGDADNFFAAIGANQEDTVSVPTPKRKSTTQVIEGQVHTHDGDAGMEKGETLAQLIEESAESSPSPLGEATAEDNDDFFSQLGKSPSLPQEPAQASPAKSTEDDIDARWKAALADDVFLDDDGEGFLPSDDEGFLPSDDEAPPATAANGQPAAQHSGPGLQRPAEHPQGHTAMGYTQPAAQRQQQYQPQARPEQAWVSQQPRQPVVNPYVPSQQNAYQPQAPPLRQSHSGYFAQATQQQTGLPNQPPPPTKKAESFVDRKEGYSSPYDLPIDVAPPVLRKRPSSLAQNLVPTMPGFGSMVTPPMRSSSMGNVFTPPPTGHHQQPSVPPKPKPQPQKFFEELPIAPPKARSASAMGNRASLGSIGAPPMGPPPRTGSFGHMPPRPESTQGFYGSTQQQGGIGLVTPGQSPQRTSNAASRRYSPAPHQMQRSASYAPPSSSSMAGRYSPAPSHAPAQALTYQHLPAAQTPGMTSTSYTPAPAQMPAHGKYAPRPVETHQSVAPTAALYAPPPPPNQRAQTSGPVLQQGFMSPPSTSQQYQTMVPPNASHTSVQNSLPTLPSQGAHISAQQELAENYGHGQRPESSEYLHSSRPGTADGAPAGIHASLEQEQESVTAQPHINGHSPEQSFVPPPPPSMAQGRYTPVTGTLTPPPSGAQEQEQSNISPPMNAAQHQMSPQKGHNVRSSSSDLSTFSPPPRAQSQSPGMTRAKINRKASTPYERPSSALAQTSTMHYVSTMTPTDTRRSSVEPNFMKPNDMTAHDDLERWKGKPIFTWGFGGTATVMFPKRSQRFSADSHEMMIKVSPGEVSIRSLKDTLPLDDDIEKFPGPIWTGSKSAHKTKKKEVLAYMTERIETFERFVLEINQPDERRDLQEKSMLWKVVKLMVEYDGVVEGALEVEKAVREVLIPEAASTNNNESGGSFVSMAGFGNLQPPNAERVDADALMTFRRQLLAGDRESAVWHAVDKRLWAHALLISGTVGKDLWKRVVGEFVKNEVKTLGDGSESLAVLYETLAGNWEESVDELVPPSARMGMPMLTTSSGNQQSVDERLNKWRETLGLVLSNRSPGDQAAILALGRLLVSYGRVYAGHLCFIFARQGPLGGGGALFGGAEDQTSDFTLLGVDHRSRPYDFARDMDAIILSEIYELAVSLAPHAGTANPVLPHLQIYKLHHALILAENGRKTDAQRYCDSVGSAIKAWNKPSPYFHQGFFGALEDLTKRLQAAPREETSGASSKWIPKLTSDSVSNSMWGAFNKFVSGDEDNEKPEGDAPLGNAEIDGQGGMGPNAQSMTQAGADLYGVYSSGGNLYQPGAQPGTGPSANFKPPPIIAQSATASRYAPSTARSSLDGPRSTYEPTGSGSPYEPKTYEPTAPINPYEPSFQQASQPSSFDGSRNAPSNYAPYHPRSSLEATPEVPEIQESTGYSGYAPSSEAPSNGYAPAASGSYEPPNSGYTPYQPDQPDSEDDAKEENKPKKKKGIMDDDDDSFAAANEKIKKQEEEKKKAEEKKKEAEASGQKKGWFGGWFGGAKKDPNTSQGPVRAKLGEESSFYYDPDLKRWVNKKAGADASAPAKPPPPPMAKRPATPSSTVSAPPGRPLSAVSSVDGPSAAGPLHSGSAPPGGNGLAPPPGPPARGLTPSPAPSDAGSIGGPEKSRSPSRPPTAVAGKSGDAMDDLLGPPGGRRSTPAGGRKGRKGGASRYVEVIPGQQ